MKRDIERMPIIMRRIRTSRLLVPVSAFDAELLDRYSIDADLEVTVRQRRSSKQNRLYWKTLAKVIEATDAYPSPERLHDAIKDELGYVVYYKRFDGTMARNPDSTAFGNMDQAEFKVFFERAMELLARLTGSDPLAFVEREAA